MPKKSNCEDNQLPPVTGIWVSTEGNKRRYYTSDEQLLKNLELRFITHLQWFDTHGEIDGLPFFKGPDKKYKTPVTHHTSNPNVAALYMTWIQSDDRADFIAYEKARKKDQRDAAARRKKINDLNVVALEQYKLDQRKK